MGNSAFQRYKRGVRISRRGTHNQLRPNQCNGELAYKSLSAGIGLIVTIWLV